MSVFLPDTPCEPARGSWSGPFGHVDTSDLLNLDPSLFSLQRFNEKRWCYIGIFHPDIIFGCAVIHLGYMASAFAFGFDRKKCRMTQFSFVFPPIGQVQYDRNPEQGICSYRSLMGKIILTHNYPSGKSGLTTSLFFPGKSLKADIDIMMPDSGFSPMHFHMPMENGKTAFTTKAAGLDAKGDLFLNNKKFDLAQSDTFAIVDWTNGFYPRKTFWNWASGAGKTHDGTRIGFNFSSGVYEYGLLENTVWINGAPHQIGPVEFIYNAANPEHPWQISSRDGQIKFIFKPEGHRRANDNLGIIESKFIQPFGTFEGSIQIENAMPIQFDNIIGVAEEHFAKW